MNFMRAMQYNSIVNVICVFTCRMHFTIDNLQQLSLMLYLGGNLNSARKDFIALALVKGFIMLTWDLGSGKYNNKVFCC